MRAQDRLRFLFGPYRPPALRRGDITYCCFRDSQVIITGWSNGLIQWPRCRALGSRGGSGLLVDETLAFVVRHESAVAIKHWFGVSTKAVWNWRTALAVRRMDNPGSRRLILAACNLGARTMQIYGLPDHVCNLISERSRRLNLIRFARAKPAKRPWTAGELEQLGQVEDSLLGAQRKEPWRTAGPTSS